MVEIATGRVLSLDLTGPITIAGATEQEGQKVKFKGTGQNNFKVSSKKLK